MRALLIGLALLAVGVSAWMLWPRSPRQAPVSAPKLPEGAMTETERRAYVEAFVRAAEVRIVPDTKPDSDEPVPGLKRVVGKVLNEGERWVDKVVLKLDVKDGAGEVLGSEFHDVVEIGRLEPGQGLEFAFQIRDRSKFEGDFEYRLQ
ncbi:MAG: hypothetical protein AAGD10_09280 [Myxococcota bacterium]